MKNIAAPAGQSRFPVKLICCIAFGSVSSACFYLNLSLSFYSVYCNTYNPANKQLCNHLLDLLNG